MNTKLALYGTLMATFFIVPFTAQAYTTDVVEATPTFADKQDASLVEQQSLMTSTSTSDYAAERKDLSGFYAGVGANYARSSGTVKITVKNKQNGYEKDISSNDFGANINFGYGHAWGMFYLGGEAFFDYAPIDLEDNDSLSELSSDYDVGAALKIGLVMFDRLMLYGLAGVSYATLDTKWEGISAYSSGNFVPMFGGGLEYLFTDHWAAKLQYTFTSYGSLSQNIFEKRGYKFESIDRDTLTLGITYHF